MRSWLLPLSLIVACFAAPSAMAATAQQNKMSACQKSAGEKQLQGKERQAFVTECLKAKAPEPEAQPTQGQKLGACSKEAAAKGLKGAERNQYLSECSKR